MGDYGSREVFVYLCVGWYQAHHIWQKDYTIKTDKKVGNIKVALLSDSHVGTTFIGRQDRSEEVEKNKGRATMSELTSSPDDSKFSIVMNYQPCDYANQAKSGVDLVVSGHTHGGQLFPLMNIENLTGLGDDRVYGYEKRDNTNFIVTSGISDWAIKFKTGCKSEYVIVNIQGK